MILVTGGTGLVGSHLLYELTSRQLSVRATYRTVASRDRVKEVFTYYTNTPEKQFKYIEWVKADITDITSMIPAFDGIEEVYHCAALISFNPKDYIEMRKVNIHGTAIVVNLSIDANVRKLCYVSSIAAIGDHPNKEFIDEAHEFNVNEDNSGYAITKYGGEMEVWRASQEGVDVIIVNPGVIFGPGFWHSGSGSLFKMIYKGFPFYTNGTTGFVGINDVIHSMVLLMNSEIKNQRFILVSENLSFKKVFSLMANALQVKPPHKEIGPLVTALFWRWEMLKSFLSGKTPKLTKHSAKSMHSQTRYKNDKIIKAIGLEFTQVKEVIAKTAAFFSI